MARVVMIVLDGATDRPCAELGGLTPLQYAHVPNLDGVAAKGLVGRVTVIAEGIPPESDSGSMALLGYDPLEFYTGRGPLEGLGLGFIDTSDQSISFRINFASFDKKSDRLDRRTARGLSDVELQELARSIERDVPTADLSLEVRIYAYGHHRGVLRLRSTGQPLSGIVTNTDPGFDNLGYFGVPSKANTMRPRLSESRDGAETSKETAKLLNEFVARVALCLEGHPVNVARIARGDMPANMILVRDGGPAPIPLPRFQERFGHSLFMLGQLPAEKAIAQMVGARFEYSLESNHSNVRSYYHSNLERINGAEEDVVFVHLKGPDEPGHDNRPKEKAGILESIDHDFIGPLVRSLHESSRLVVTSDHATPCEVGLHTDDPVVTCISGAGLCGQVDSRFSEDVLTDSALMGVRGRDVMALALGGVTP